MKNIRISAAGLKALSLLLKSANLSGADMSRSANIGPGTLYPLLIRFEKAGIVSGRWERVNPSVVGRPRKRLYNLTPKGRKFAKAELKQFL